MFTTTDNVNLKLFVGLHNPIFLVILISLLMCHNGGIWVWRPPPMALDPAIGMKFSA
jgi:hypothetical protein